MEQSHIDPPSDLIYLFLDGEATGVEQAVLFERLAHDSDLQAEFAAALKIREATELERNQARPPAAVTAGLFRQAGFAPPGAPPLPGPALPGLPGAASGFRLRSILPPGIAAALAALVTALLFLGRDAGRVDDLERKIDLLERRSMASTLPTASPATEHEISPAGKLASGEDGAGSYQATSRGDDTPDRSPHGWRERIARSTGTGRDDDNGGEATPRTTSLPAQIGRISLRTIGREESAAAPILPDRAAQLPMLDGDPFRSNASGGDRAEEEAPDGALMASIRSRSDLLYSPDQTAPASGPWFNNISLALLYRLEGGLRLGVEAGQENFPHYDLTDGGPVYAPRLVWGGATLDWAPSIAAWNSPLRPSLRATLGLTPIGPIGKGSIGIDLVPERRVRLTLAAEGTLMIYSHENMLFSARKLGLTYGVDVSF